MLMLSKRDYGKWFLTDCIPLLSNEIKIIDSFRLSQTVQTKIKRRVEIAIFSFLKLKRRSRFNTLDGAPTMLSSY